MRRFVAQALGVGVALAAAHAMAGSVTPPGNLVLRNVPPIPAALAKALEPYADFRPHGLLSWHPRERDLLVSRRAGSASQVHHIGAPGAVPLPLTDFAEPVAGATYQPTHGEYFVFRRDHRLYRFDVSGRRVTPLGPEGERALDGTFSADGSLYAYATVQLDAHAPERAARTTLHVLDPARPESARVVARWERGAWTSLRFSEDGKRLVCVEVVSTADRRVWVIDVASGRSRRVPGASKQPVAYANPDFSRDGKGLFLTSDRGSRPRRLAYLSIADGRERALTGHLGHDVDHVEIDRARELIAFTTSENGAHVLRFMDLKALKELPRPPLVPGVIGRLEWRPGSTEVAFDHASARSPGDVFSYDLKANRTTRWTNGNSPGVNTSEFAEPRAARWKGFDGLERSALHYPPPGRFEGRRPVLVKAVMGSTAPPRPGFLGRYNHLVNELGIAVVHVHLRAADTEALLDWIASQPGLDASKVVLAAESDGDPLPGLHDDRFAGIVAVGERAATLQARGLPAWSLSAQGDAEGFRGNSNEEFLFYVLVEFARRTLLPSAAFP